MERPAGDDGGAAQHQTDVDVLMPPMSEPVFLRLPSFPPASDGFGVVWTLGRVSSGWRVPSCGMVE